MRNHRNLQVWGKAHKLTLAVYQEASTFPREERFGLTSKIRRSCISIPANLAEGCGRRSDGEMARFVQISMGSCSEFSSHLLLASELGFLDQATYKSLGTDWSEVMRMLSALSQRLKSARARSV